MKPSEKKATPKLIEYSWTSLCLWLEYCCCYSKLTTAWSEKMCEELNAAARSVEASEMSSIARQLGRPEYVAPWYREYPPLNNSQPGIASFWIDQVACCIQSMEFVQHPNIPDRWRDGENGVCGCTKNLISGVHTNAWVLYIPFLTKVPSKRFFLSQDFTTYKLPQGF